VKLPKKWDVWPKRILNEEQTVRVLAHLEDPHLLICETCLATGTRISEALGLQLRHLDLDLGVIRIEQRNWHGDIDAPKTEKSKRVLALGTLVDRYRAYVEKKKLTHPDALMFPQEYYPELPLSGTQRPGRR
jgi:integrase